jgi:hypothetical protein
MGMGLVMSTPCGPLWTPMDPYGLPLLEA